MHKFPYRWTLKDARFTKDKGKVFSCFACGGGSTMGYKLAGFDVIGCNEIDPRMNKVYVANHHPRFNYLAPIQEFKLRKDLPAELYNLDILDGSPPCSSFSSQGNRGEDWGKEKKFREGQASQVLDTLFFDFIDLAKELQPKAVIAENVKGLLLGEAIQYVRRIYEEFDKAGYYCQHFLLNAQYMGVPQQRERVFFICLRKDLAEPFLYQYDMFEQRPRITMDFNEEPIPISEFTDYQGREITSPILRKLWDNRQYGDKDQSEANLRLFGKASNFGQSYVYQHEVCWTLTAKEMSIMHFDQPRCLSEHEVDCVSSFPQDYDYMNESPHYIAGMSVPPVMMAQVASRVYDQWLSRIPQ
jgi:DNA (cytosine-5)-methyltransferase 1